MPKVTQEAGRAERWVLRDKAPPRRKRPTDGSLPMFDNNVMLDVLFWGELGGLQRSEVNI